MWEIHMNPPISGKPRSKKASIEYVEKWAKKHNRIVTFAESDSIVVILLEGKKAGEIIKL